MRVKAIYNQGGLVLPEDIQLSEAQFEVYVDLPENVLACHDLPPVVAIGSITECSVWQTAHPETQAVLKKLEVLKQELLTLSKQDDVTAEAEQQEGQVDNFKKGNK